MPKRKNPREMNLTNEAIERFVFPKKVREKVQEVVQEDAQNEPAPKPRKPKSSRR